MGDTPMGGTPMGDAPMALTSADHSPLLPRALSSALVDRKHFAHLAGKSFYPPGSATANRDLYEALGYVRELTVADHWARYHREDLAARVIDAYPAAVWESFSLQDGEHTDDDIDTPLELAFNALSKRIGLKTLLRRADMMARLTQYSVLVISTLSDAPVSLSDPLPPGTLRSTDDIARIWVYPSDVATVEAWDEDPTSPRYGLPVSYRIGTLSAGQRTVSKRPTTSFSVHHTRCIHIVCGALDDEVYSRPMLEKAWNRFDDIQKIVGGGSEATWSQVKPPLIFNVADPSKPIADLTELKDQIDEYEHNMRRVLRLTGMDTTQIEANVQDFSNNAHFILSIIAGTYGMPVRLLIGSERGELASSQDDNNWNDRVDEQREDYAEPCILIPFINWCITHGALPPASDPEWSIQWPTRDEETDRSRAETTALLATANKAHFGAAGVPLFTGEQILDTIWDMKSEVSAPMLISVENTDPPEPSTALLTTSSS